MKKTILIKTRFTMLHRWVAANKKVAFLSSFHRHIFHVELEIGVTDSDRELEFFMVIDALDSFLKSFPQKSNVSCEMIAEKICRWAKKTYGPSRSYLCRVLEDGENGSVVEL